MSVLQDLISGQGGYTIYFGDLLQENSCSSSRSTDPPESWGFSAAHHSWSYRPQLWSVLLLSRFHPLTCGKSPDTAVPNPAVSLAWCWRNFSISEWAKENKKDLVLNKIYGKTSLYMLLCIISEVKYEI